jgi:mannose-P-dolichol utilization defect protein 1
MDKFFECAKKTLTFHFENECTSYLISKMLSIIIVVFSFTNKLPQIIYMYKSKQINGLSSMSVYLDIFSVLCAALYPFHKGYPFLAYGERLIVLIENIIIFFLAWKYDLNQSSDRENLSFTIIVCSFLFVCYKGTLDENAWKMVGLAKTLFSMTSKISQILKSCKENTTGPLSTITYGLNMISNIARIYTSFKETKDSILISGYVVSLILNFAVFLQIIYYNRPLKKDIENTDKKEDKTMENKENNQKDDKKSKKKKKD